MGFLRAGQPPKSWVEAFQQGLRERGYVDGQNVVVEFRFTDGSVDRLPRLAVAPEGTPLSKPRVELSGREGRPVPPPANEHKSAIAAVHVQTAITLSTAIVEGGALPGVKTVHVVAPTLSAPDRQAQRERALRLHANGMEQLERGNVSGARMFFSLAAEAGLVRSMRALAGTYDPTQLAKLKVLGMQADIDAAQKWYEKARDLGAIAAADRAAGEEGTDKPATDLTRFRAAYTSGDGLAYVVIPDDTGEHIYRYGDESRSASKKAKR